MTLNRTSLTRTRHARTLVLTGGLLAAIVSMGLPAHAQAPGSPSMLVDPVAPALPGASAPVKPPTGPRVLTPAERRDNATPVDDIRPEGHVKPQLSLPLGQTDPSRTAAEAKADRRGTSKTKGGVDDAIARCKAAATAEARQACLDKAHKDGKY
jgi:hypothetical protein